MVPTDDEQESLDLDDNSQVKIDLVEERDGISETEQEISEYEEFPIVADASSFLGKAKKTKWMKYVPSKIVRI